MNRLSPLLLALALSLPSPSMGAEAAGWDRPTKAGPALPQLRPVPRPDGEKKRRRCTADGDHCIALGTYVEDVCGLIETASTEAGLDPGFFARLLWKESLFDASAVSPAGAQGIAQFMPGTAELRGLADPFNPAEAIVASAEYLADLAERFGNAGLAAAAYNGGENRMERFLSKTTSTLPAETLNYVSAITGHSVRDWRDDPPASVDYRLDKTERFAEACIAQARTRKFREFRDPVPPWGVIIAAGRRAATAESFAGKARAENAGILGGRSVSIVRAALPGHGQARQYTAQIRADTRQEALALCRRLRGNGAFCLVQRN